MNYQNLRKMQEIIGKTIQKADFELAKELMDLLSDFIMESKEADDEWSELYIDCKNYYDYARRLIYAGVSPSGLFSLVEFLVLFQDEYGFTD